MPTIKKRYILDKKKRPVGVVLDLKTFERIEEMVEDQLLGRIMDELDGEKPLSLAGAKRYYAKLAKG